MTAQSQELPIIQKTYDLIKWYVPHLNKLPRNHKFVLGDRVDWESSDSENGAADNDL